MCSSTTPLHAMEHGAMAWRKLETEVFQSSSAAIRSLFKLYITSRIWKQKSKKLLWHLLRELSTVNCSTTLPPCCHPFHSLTPQVFFCHWSPSTLQNSQISIFNYFYPQVCEFFTKPSSIFEYFIFILPKSLYEELSLLGPN